MRAKELLLDTKEIKFLKPPIEFLYKVLDPKAKVPHKKHAYYRNGLIWATNRKAAHVITNVENLPVGFSENRPDDGYWITVEKAGGGFLVFADPSVDAEYPDLTPLFRGKPKGDPAIRQTLETSLDVSQLLASIILKHQEHKYAVDYIHLERLMGKGRAVEVFMYPPDSGRPIYIDLLEGHGPMAIVAPFKMP